MLECEANAVQTESAPPRCFPPSLFPSLARPFLPDRQVLSELQWFDFMVKQKVVGSLVLHVSVFPVCGINWLTPPSWEIPVNMSN